MNHSLSNQLFICFWNSDSRSGVILLWTETRSMNWSWFYICYFREIHLGQRRSWWMGEVLAVILAAWSTKTWSTVLPSGYPGLRWPQGLKLRIRLKLLRWRSFKPSQLTSRLVWTWCKCWRCSSRPTCDLPKKWWRVRCWSPSCFFLYWLPPQKSQPHSSTRAHPSLPLPR